MVRLLRTYLWTVRTAPLLIALVAAGYGAAYFMMPQELEAQQEGQVVRHYECQHLDRIFEPAAVVENKVRGWWHDHRRGLAEKIDPDLSIRMDRS